MGYVAYMRKGDKYIKIVTSTEYGLRKSQGFKMTTKDEYERANADSLPVLPGSPLDERLASAQRPAADGDAAAGDVSDPAEQLKWARLAINEADKHIASLQSEIAATRAALEPFAEAWLQVPLGVDSRLWIDRYVEGVIIGGESLGIDTSTLEDAHTAYFGLPAATASG